MARPFVSVLIDTYNHERFIEEAIESALAQDFPISETEILVVDDGSTDHTPEILRKFGPRVRVVRKSNGGQASAFNAGIRECCGEVVAFLDGDDWWKKNKVSRVTEAFEKNPSAGVVGHGIIQIETTTGHGSVLAPATPGYFELQTNEGAQTFRNYMCFLGTSRVSIRREVLAKILPIPEALVVEADEFMSAMAVAHGGAVLLADSLTYYRLHDQNLYQFRTDDPVRMRRKSNALASLAEELPIRLAETGVSPESIAIIVEPIRVLVARMRLMLDGGMPWETYCVERADYRLSYRDTSPGYRIYKQFSLLLALAMPPRLFYRLRGWYDVHNFRRFRRWLGEPVPAAPVREQAVTEARRADGSA